MRDGEESEKKVERNGPLERNEEEEEEVKVGVRRAKDDREDGGKKEK